MISDAFPSQGDGFLPQPQHYVASLLFATFAAMNGSVAMVFSSADVAVIV
jgi:hypothetical protein